MDVGSVDPIVLVRETHSPAERTWRALTEPDEIARWFTDASPLEGPGTRYRLDFGDSAVVGSIVDVDPGRTFAHTWRWDGDEAAATTRVRWTVERTDNGSRITLTHDGWAEAGLDVAARDDHEGYWLGYLDDLVDLLDGEAGEDSRTTA